MHLISKAHFNFLCASNLRIGFYGGSFNPFHYGHFNIVLSAIKALKLDKLILLVANASKEKFYSKSSLNRAQDIINYYQKNININQNYNIYVSNIEEELNYNCTYLIAKYIAARSQLKRYFILGADSIINFHNWEHCDIISYYMNLVVFDRPNWTYKAINCKSINYIDSFYKIKYNYVSSTNIRNNTTIKL